MVPSQQQLEDELIGRACGFPYEYNLDRLLEIIPQIQNINATDEEGWTALHHAAYRGEIKLINALIKAGADLNRRTLQHLLPVEVATFECGYNNTEAINAFRVLLQNGSHRPDHEHTFGYGKTPSDFDYHIRQLDQSGALHIENYWFSRAQEAWDSWQQQDHGNITKLTPHHLPQFCSLNKISDLLHLAQQTDQIQEVALLFSNPETLPHIAANAAPALSAMIAQTLPQSTIALSSATPPTPLQPSAIALTK